MRVVNIACIGGGPAGLYLGILVKRVAPEHDVVIYERNRPADTFGFGVVFSDATLGHLAAADPETHAQITARFARWDDIEIHVGDEVLRSTGHGFCGIERKALLAILQARAKQLGVRVEYEHEVRALADVRADVIVACDGVASGIRDALATELGPRVDVRSNKFVWLGSTVPYRAFTFIFKPTRHGLYRVHAYRYAEGQSTFIVECRPDTWRAAGFEGADEDTTVAKLSDLFAEELGGHRLIKNRSIWRSFPTVRCARWSAGNVVLVGDAAHTAHFSIGSGTKLAMEDAIALRDELRRHARHRCGACRVRSAPPPRSRSAAGRRASQPRVVRRHRALHADGAGSADLLADDAQPARVARLGRAPRPRARAQRRAIARGVSGRDRRAAAGADRVADRARRSHARAGGSPSRRRSAPVRSSTSWSDWDRRSTSASLLVARMAPLPRLPRRCLRSGHLAPGHRPDPARG